MLESVCEVVKESAIDSTLQNNTAERPSLHTVTFPAYRREVSPEVCGAPCGKCHIGEAVRQGPRETVLPSSSLLLPEDRRVARSVCGPIGKAPRTFPGETSVH